MVLGEVEGRIQIDEVNGFILEITPEDVGVIAAVKHAHEPTMPISGPAFNSRLGLAGTARRAARADVTDSPMTWTRKYFGRNTPPPSPPSRRFSGRRFRRKHSAQFALEIQLETHEQRARARHFVVIIQRVEIVILIGDVEQTQRDLAVAMQKTVADIGV